MLCFPGYSVGRDDSFAGGTIKDVQLILASHVPLDCAYWRSDDRWLRDVDVLCVDANGCYARAEIPSGMVVSYDSLS